MKTLDKFPDKPGKSKKPAKKAARPDAARPDAARPDAARPDAAEKYRLKLEENASRERRRGAAARNIGLIPAVHDPARKESCEFDLVKFMLAYQSGIFRLPFCRDQIKAIRKIEEVVLRGGTNALGMPRGQGKTSFCRTAALWGEVYGHRKFTVIVGATDVRAKQSLFAIKRQIQNNTVFGQDFPEVAYPISKLERITIRANAQLYELPDGTTGFTDLTWGSDEIVLPQIEGARSSGGIITCCGITGDILGQLYPVGDISVRPELVIVDDPQTYESANSASQVSTRERIILADILGLAGPGKKISVVLPFTVKRKGDLADRFLSPKIHSAFNGTRTKLVYAWPVGKDLWDQYRAIRTTFDPDTEGDQKRAWADATKFYVDRREAMDAGSEVSWAERFDPDEVSALQNAMNLRIDRGDEAFFSEYQNDPLGDVADDTTVPAETIRNKVNGIPRGIVSESASWMTAFIDVQETVLFYMICSWGRGFGGAIVDYGSYPDQQRSYFRLRDADKTMASETGIHGQEAQTRAALLLLSNAIISKEWRKQGGSAIRVGKCLIDAGDQTDVVYEVCRSSDFSAMLTPSHGKGIRAAQQPMGMWTKRPGSLWGTLPFWVEQASQQRTLPHIIYDTNFFKSFLQARLAVDIGNPGALSLYGNADIVRAGGHRMLCDHLTSEYPTIEEVGSRKVTMWTQKPNSENHYLDCLIGCTVAASRIGVSLAEHATAQEPSKPVSFSQMQAAQKAKGKR